MNEIINIIHKIRPDLKLITPESHQQEIDLDSLDIIRLVSELDQKYDISIDGKDIIPDNFINIESINSLVHKAGGKI